MSLYLGSASPAAMQDDDQWQLAGSIVLRRKVQKNISLISNRSQGSREISQFQILA
jgi:hypothetical protein